MTNTKFRKRALLSSVAMLLVALVALGSATFAWFAENPNVDAHGLKIKTTASDGLEIRAELQGTWGTSASLNNGSTDAFNLSPASQVQNVNTTYNGDTFFTAKATNADGYASGDNTFSGASKGNTGAKDVYAEKVYFRLSQTSSTSAERNVILTGVTITQDADNDNDLANAIRVSICDASNKILGTYALSAATTNQTIPAGATDKKVSQLTLVDYTPAITTSLTNLSVPMVSGVKTTSDTSASLAKYVTVYVYLDGQDTLCKTNNVEECDVAAILSGIQLDFSLAAQV